MPRILFYFVARHIQCPFEQSIIYLTETISNVSGFNNY